MKSPIVFLFALAIFSCGHLNAQYKLRDSLCIANGMPSEYVSQSIIDSNGFLWIASERGVIRYDGRKYELFDALRGLQDINIVRLALEKNGTLWTKSSSGILSFFNESRQQFERNSALDSLKPFVGLQALPDQGIRARTKHGICFIHSLKPTRYFYKQLDDSASVLQELPDASTISFKINREKKSISFYLIRNTRMVEKKEIDLNYVPQSISSNDYAIYLFDSTRNHISYIQPVFKTSLQIQQKEIVTNKQYYTQSFSGEYLLLHNRHHSLNKDIVDIDVYDKKSLKFLFTIGHNVVAFDLFNDQKNNCWLSSDKGLFKFSTTKEVTNFLPDAYSKNVFYSAASFDSIDYFGNDASEIIEHRNENIFIHKVTATSKNEWQRELIVQKDKVFSFSDGGIVLNYNRAILYKNKALPVKEAVQLNDTLILVCNDDGLYTLNTSNLTIQFYSKAIPEQCIGRISSNEFATGSLDGLRICNMFNPSEIKSIHPEIFKLNKPSVICYSNDSLLIVGTVSGGIYFLRDNNIIAHLTTQQQLRSNQIRTIILGKEHEIIAGTFSGVSRIHYTLINNQLKFAIQNISAIDGLSSETINALLYRNGKLLALTDKGISMIPEKVTYPDIKIVLKQVLVNQVEQPIKLLYDLSPSQNEISISFSGVDINQYYDHAQYSTDEGLHWIDLKNSDFQIQWASGEHHLWLRAVDVNVNISRAILKLLFNIDTPFFKTWWFRFLVLFILFAIALYINTLLTKRKQQKQIDQLLNQQAMDELEIQALKAQMNPHFVFNCLNSIKGFIYDEDFEKADLYLDKFASLLRSTLDFSTKPSISLKLELDYIDTYLTLEKLRFGNKFDYTIACDETINQHEIAIPAMLLQPYVENAIKHGVCNLDDGLGKINIKLYLVDDKLHIEIDDNGVGRKNADLLKQQRRSTHESKGTILTQRRIELYQINLKIIDKHDLEGNAKGTCIHLIIPIPLHQ